MEKVLTILLAPTLFALLAAPVFAGTPAIRLDVKNVLVKPVKVTVEINTFPDAKTLPTRTLAPNQSATFTKSETTPDPGGVFLGWKITFDDNCSYNIGKDCKVQAGICSRAAIEGEGDCAIKFTVAQ